MKTKKIVLKKKGNYLKSNHTITLHTRLAKALFFGNRKKGHIGLREFAQQMTSIARAAKQGNTEATTCLTTVNEQLDQLQQAIQECQAYYRKKMNSNSSIHLTLVTNETPVTFLIRFATTHAYQGAFLLASIDELVRMLLTLEEIGLISAKERLNYNQQLSCKIGTIFLIPYRLLA